MKPELSVDQIPHVTFRKKISPEIEFDICTLSSLFSRQSQLNHRLSIPHRVAFYHVIFVIDGEGEHHIDFQSYAYAPNSMLFISRGQVHSFQAVEKLDGFVILFTDEFITKNYAQADMSSFLRLYNYHQYTPLIRLTENRINEMKHIINEIYEEYHSSELYAKEEILRLYLKLLLLKAERISGELKHKDNNKPWLTTFSYFKTELEKNYKNTRNVADYAKVLDISYKHLNDICKQVVGKTAKRVIDDFVMLEIKRQIATTTYSTKKLSEVMGFDEPTNFVKYFKKNADITPMQFKQTLL